MNGKAKSKEKCHLKDQCGSCEFFDGDYLDDGGKGKGECSYEPPIYIGPTGNTTEILDIFNVLDDFWVQPMVGVASRKCSHYKQRTKKAWWYK